MEQMEQAFKKASMRYVIGKEVGAEGTPHLQGYVTAGTKFRWSSLDLPKTIHWEKCKGSEQDNIKYCIKDGEFTMHGLKAPRQLKLITPSYSWEQEILEIIAKEPDDRTIYWYWSRDGNVGKTCFCKYLTVKHGAMPLAGKGADVRNGIVEYTKKTGKPLNWSYSRYLGHTIPCTYPTKHWRISKICTSTLASMRVQPYADQVHICLCLLTNART